MTRSQKEESAIELLLSKRVDGILLTKAAGDFSPSLRQMINEVNIPFVLVMRTYPQLTKDAVISDDYQGAYEAVCHLARAGRRRIGLISGPLKISNAKERWRGFRDALEEKGLPYEPDLVVEGDYRIESGFRAGHALLSHRPDGIYVANHLMTIGLLKAVDEMGLKCPEDFGLVSFDDYPWLGVFRPRLTTVELPKHQLGSEAAELLIQRIGGDHGKPVLKKLQPELRIRESCGFAQFVSSEQRHSGLLEPEAITSRTSEHVASSSRKTISSFVEIEEFWPKREHPRSVAGVDKSDSQPDQACVLRPGLQDQSTEQSRRQRQIQGQTHPGRNFCARTSFCANQKCSRATRLTAVNASNAPKVTISAASCHGIVSTAT